LEIEVAARTESRMVGLSAARRAYPLVEMTAGGMGDEQVVAMESPMVGEWALSWVV
jgi:hypothetical protein